MKIAIIKDIRTFLTIARTCGYSFIQNYCIKSIVYDALDCVIDIKINLTNGVISFKAYTNNVSFDLTLEDKQYLLKDINYLVKWIDINGIKEKII